MSRREQGKGRGSGARAGRMLLHGKGTAGEGTGAGVRAVNRVRTTTTPTHGP